MYGKLGEDIRDKKVREFQRKYKPHRKLQFVALAIGVLSGSLLHLLLKFYHVHSFEDYLFRMRNPYSDLIDDIAITGIFILVSFIMAICLVLVLFRKARNI